MCHDVMTSRSHIDDAEQIEGFFEEGAGLRQLARDCGSVIHEDIEVIVALADRLDCGEHVFISLMIDLETSATSARFPDGGFGFGDGSTERMRAASIRTRREIDEIAGTSEGDGDALPDAAACTGHERNLLLHAFSTSDFSFSPLRWGLLPGAWWSSPAARSFR